MHSFCLVVLLLCWNIIWVIESSPLALRYMWSDLQQWGKSVMERRSRQEACGVKRKKPEQEGTVSCSENHFVMSALLEINSFWCDYFCSTSGGAKNLFSWLSLLSCTTYIPKFFTRDQDFVTDVPGLCCMLQSLELWLRWHIAVVIVSLRRASCTLFVPMHTMSFFFPVALTAQS